MIRKHRIAGELVRWYPPYPFECFFLTHARGAGGHVQEPGVVELLVREVHPPGLHRPICREVQVLAAVEMLRLERNLLHDYRSLEDADDGGLTDSGASEEGAGPSERAVCGGQRSDLP